MLHFFPVASLHVNSVFLFRFYMFVFVGCNLNVVSNIRLFSISACVSVRSSPSSCLYQSSKILKSNIELNTCSSLIPSLSHPSSFYKILKITKLSIKFYSLSYKFLKCKIFNPKFFIHFTQLFTSNFSKIIRPIVFISAPFI